MNSHPGLARERGTRAVLRGLRQRGFTLMELMVSITVLGVLTAITVPSFINMMNRNRLAGEANELLAAIQYARTEAIRTNTNVTFCGASAADADSDAECADGQQPYWVVLGRTAGGAQEQLRVNTVSAPIKVSSDLEKITFSADGLARDPATKALVTGEIVVCMETTNPPQNKRVLNVASGSRVAVSTPEADGLGSCE